MKFIQSTWAAAFAMSLIASIAQAQGKPNVITTTEDLAAIAREVGGDRITVESIARGYQDPHFVEAKPSFILKLQKADILVTVGRELEIGWLPPLIQQSRNAKVQVGGSGYIDASVQARILEVPQGQITRAMGDVHPLGNPHYWLDPENGKVDRQGDRRQALTPSTERPCLLRAAVERLLGPPHRGREALGGNDGAVQRHEGRDLPSLVPQLRRAVRTRRDRLRRATAGHSAVATAHARSDQRDEKAEREAGAGRAVFRSQDAQLHRPRRPAPRSW